MLNLLSLIIGGLALLLGIIAFIPFLGWAYWLIIPVAMVGALVGFFSSSNSGRNLNFIVIIIGIIRLSLGGGIF